MQIEIISVQFYLLIFCRMVWIQLINIASIWFDPLYVKKSHQNIYIKKLISNSFKRYIGKMEIQ